MSLDLPLEPAQVLRLQPGDLLVFQCLKRLTTDQVVYLKNRLASTVPEGVNTLVLQPETQVYKLAASRIDEHLDNVLRAAGSSLKHYTMQKSLDDMRAAMRAAITGATA